MEPIPRTMADLDADRTERYAALQDALQALRITDFDPPVSDILHMAEYIRTGVIQDPWLAKAHKECSP